MAWFDLDKMPLHVRLFKHGIDGLQPGGTLRLSILRTMIQITPVLDNACPSQVLAYPFLFGSRAQLLP
jgi:hypothetical protein